MNVITKTVSLPDGRTISIETGKVALFVPQKMQFPEQISCLCR